VPVSEEVRDLISSCLDLNIARRLTAAEAMGHPWLIDRKAHMNRPLLPCVLSNLKQFNQKTTFKTRILTMLSR
jgi:serine/threonine protein kinase